MKTARRQELRTNELAQSLEELREFFRQYGNYVLIGVIAVAVVLMAVGYVRRSQAEALQAAHDKAQSLPTATDDDVRNTIKELKRLAAETDDPTFVAESIRTRAALALGRAHTGDDGQPKVEFLDLAEEAANELLKRFPDRGLDAGLVLFQLATIEQDRFVLDGDVAHKERARAYLERVRDSAALVGTPLQRMALDRLNELDDTFTPVVLAPAPPSPTPPSPGGFTVTPVPSGASEEDADTPSTALPQLPPVPAGEASGADQAEPESTSSSQDSQGDETGDDEVSPPSPSSDNDSAASPGS